MRIGIGLPSTVPGISGQILLEWASRADQGPFSTLGVIDRIVYSNYEPIAALAAVSGVTNRIQLMTTVLVAPLRDTAILAKQAATIDALSGGRLVIGLGVGSRDEDFVATNQPFHRRGRRLDEQMREMKRVWAGGEINGVGPIGPPVRGDGPQLLVGGYGDAMARRLAKWGDGYISGSGGPDRAAAAYKLATQAWQDSGRPGKPPFVACTYFAIGSTAAIQTQASIQSYYGDRTQAVLQHTPLTAEDVRRTIGQYEEIGVDNFILWPGADDLAEIDRLAELIS